MNEDFGLLVDFLRGELDAGSAARVRVRLEEDADYFSLFTRLKRTYDVLRSLPVVRPAQSAAAQLPEVPQIDPREEFVAAVRREFEARDWMSLLPWIEGREEFLRGLRTEFTVRAILCSIPQLDPTRSFVEALRAEFGARARLLSIPQIKARPEWVRALHEEFGVRATVACLPHLEPRPEFVAALRAEFAGHAIAASLPEIAVRDGFRRRLQVALFEAAREQAPEPVKARAPLPEVGASDPFRRRLFAKVLFSSRRKVRDEPKRADVNDYKWGREIERGLKGSRSSMAFTLGVHALAIAVMLFIFASNPVSSVSAGVLLGDTTRVTTPELPRGTEGDESSVFEKPEDSVGATGPEWSSADEPPPLGAGDDIPEPNFENQPEDPPPPQRHSSESTAAYSDHMRDGVSSFFRLRTQSRAQKVAYLGREDLYDALDKILRYLQKEQQKNAEGFWWHDGVEIVPSDESLREIQKVELTSMALLAFLGDGHSSEFSPVGYDWTVKRGINWLISRQRADGQIGPANNANVMIHAMATLALAEDFGLTRASHLREPLRKACRWLCAVKADGSAGFPFKVDGKASLTTSVWAYMALATARNVKVPPIDLPAQRIEEFEDWYGSVTRGTTALSDEADLFCGELVPTSAAAALSLFAPTRDNVERADALTRRISREHPELKAKGDPADMRYLFFGSLAFALKQQLGGKTGAEWQNKFADTLLQNQLESGAYEPTSDYARLYGRVFGAALAGLSIENAYRINLMRD
ncbi:MAG: terpene cyclase/mutase family protein [Planctomycetes bacterium]|nr:terpene cyclase/mutase family protein [Planctomycetota bacterium]